MIWKLNCNCGACTWHSPSSVEREIDVENFSAVSCACQFLCAHWYRQLLRIITSKINITHVESVLSRAPDVLSSVLSNDTSSQRFARPSCSSSRTTESGLRTVCFFFYFLWRERKKTTRKERENKKRENRHREIYV